MSLSTVGESSTPKYVDPRAEGIRQGLIGHCASRMVAAMIRQGHFPSKDNEGVVRMFLRIVDDIGGKWNK